MEYNVARFIKLFLRYFSWQIDNLIQRNEYLKNIFNAI